MDVNKTHVKAISGTCKKSPSNSAIDCYSLRFHDGRRFLFSFYTAKTCLYWIKSLRNNETKYLYHFKTYFQILDIFILPLTKVIQDYLKKIPHDFLL